MALVLNCYNHMIMRCADQPSSIISQPGDKVEIKKEVSPDGQETIYINITPGPSSGSVNKKQIIFVVVALTLSSVITLLFFIFTRNKNAPKENEVSIK